VCLYYIAYCESVRHIYLQIDLYLFFAGQIFGKSVCLKVSIIQLMIGISQKTV